MLATNNYNAYRFHQQVDSALSKIETILDTTRNPRYTEEKDHTYNDKFGLAEFLTNTAMAAQANALERLGMDNEIFQKLHSLSAKEKCSVTLRFTSEESCDFVKEQTVDVESKREFITEIEEGEITEGEKEKKTKTKKNV